MTLHLCLVTFASHHWSEITTATNPPRNPKPGKGNDGADGDKAPATKAKEFYNTFEEFTRTYEGAKHKKTGLEYCLKRCWFGDCSNTGRTDATGNFICKDKRGVERVHLCVRCGTAHEPTKGTGANTTPKGRCDKPHVR